MSAAVVVSTLRHGDHIMRIKSRQPDSGGYIHFKVSQIAIVHANKIRTRVHAGALHSHCGLAITSSPRAAALVCSEQIQLHDVIATAAIHDRVSAVCPRPAQLKLVNANSLSANTDLGAGRGALQVTMSDP